MNTTYSGTRRQARERALQRLFHLDFDPQSSQFETEIKETEKDALSYSESLYQGVTSSISEIDQLIEAYSQNWKLNRIASVDKNILRIAIFEMVFSTPAVDKGTAINEALELSKKYGTSDTKSFINAVLDQIAKAKKLA